MGRGNCYGRVEPDFGHQMTRKQFMEWIKFADRNRDGCISRQELRDALRDLGLNCTRWKAWRAMVHADLNHNKRIDIGSGTEIEELIKYAAKRWGIYVTN